MKSECWDSWTTDGVSWCVLEVLRDLSFSGAPWRALPVSYFSKTSGPRSDSYAVHLSISLWEISALWWMTQLSKQKIRKVWKCWVMKGKEQRVSRHEETLRKISSMIGGPRSKGPPVEISQRQYVRERTSLWEIRDKGTEKGNRRRSTADTTDPHLRFLVRGSVFWTSVDLYGTADRMLSRDLWRTNLHIGWVLKVKISYLRSSR
jgi:hypothetical protein